MNDFLFGFTCGAISLAGLSIVVSLFAMIFSKVEKEDYPEEQPDIRLTKIKSDYVRSYNND